MKNCLMNHGILLHKVKDLGIIGKLGQWFYHFLTIRKLFVRLPGGLSDDSDGYLAGLQFEYHDNDHPVISINRDVVSSN